MAKAMQAEKSDRLRNRARWGLILCGILALPNLAQAQQKPVDALTACWRETTLRNAEQNCDPAEVIVEITYRTCLSQEVAFHNALLQAGGVYGRQMAENMFANIKGRTHQTLVGLVQKARTDKGLCR